MRREVRGDVDALGVVEPLVLQSIPQGDEPERLEGGIAVRGEVAIGLRGPQERREVVEHVREARGEVRVGGMPRRHRLAREDGVHLDEPGCSLRAVRGARGIPRSTSAARSGGGAAASIRIPRSRSARTALSSASFDG